MHAWVLAAVIGGCSGPEPTGFRPPEPEPAPEVPADPAPAVPTEEGGLWIVLAPGQLGDLPDEALLGAEVSLPGLGVSDRRCRKVIRVAPDAEVETDLDIQPLHGGSSLVELPEDERNARAFARYLGLDAAPAARQARDEEALAAGKTIFRARLAHSRTVTAEFEPTGACQGYWIREIARGSAVELWQALESSPRTRVALAAGSLKGAAVLDAGVSKASVDLAARWEDVLAPARGADRFELRPPSGAPVAFPLPQPSESAEQYEQRVIEALDPALGPSDAVLAIRVATDGSALPLRLGRWLDLEMQLRERALALSSFASAARTPDKGEISELASTFGALADRVRDVASRCATLADPDPEVAALCADPSSLFSADAVRAVQGRLDGVEALTGPKVPLKMFPTNPKGRPPKLSGTGTCQVEAQFTVPFGGMSEGRSELADDVSYELWIGTRSSSESESAIITWSAQPKTRWKGVPKGVPHCTASHSVVTCTFEHRLRDPQWEQVIARLDTVNGWGVPGSSGAVSLGTCAR